MIFQVLSMMDADADGVIKVDHVLKVIELLGMENTELPAKQLKQIISVLSEEEKLQLEDSLEKILLKIPSKSSSKGNEVDEAAKMELKALEDLATQGGAKSSKNSKETQPTKHRSRNGENH